jgi:hypothetical protein
MLFGVVIMRNEIQFTIFFVKITEFQFRTLIWQHLVIVGHSNPVHVATKPLDARPFLGNILEDPE